VQRQRQQQLAEQQPPAVVAVAERMPQPRQPVPLVLEKVEFVDAGVASLFGAGRDLGGWGSAMLGRFVLFALGFEGFGPRPFGTYRG